MAGMLGTTLSVELFNVIKNKGAKLILVGDDRQLSSVERGGTFRFLSERYEAAELSEVRRQTIGWQKDVSQSLAEGNVKGAVQLLEEHKTLVWSATKEESLTNLLKDWAKDRMLNLQETHQIIAQRNVDVDALNQGARDLLRQSGQLGETEIICSTQRGRIAFAEGDRIQLTKKDKSQGLMNGTFGRIEYINPHTKIMTLHLDNGEVKELNPNTYDGLRHGYAATVYKTQGATITSVYALHSYTTNQATNYVALTRQTKSLSLYVSQEETSSTAHLIRQMGRQQERGTSLAFDTLKDIEKRQEEKTIFTPVKEATETLITKVKDKFHNNEAFYQFEKEKSPPQEAVVKVGGQEVFTQIAKRCEKYLYNYIARDNAPMTSERRERIPLQAERAANFIFYAHTLRGAEPSEQETRLYLLRAKYELDRLPQIKEKLTEDWQKRGIFDEKKDPLIIHMIAERRASIEGRLYLEAKQAGLKPSTNIPQWAEAEFKLHRAEAKTLGVKLGVKYSLSAGAASECARNALRYQETHGAKPTDTQMTSMAEIAHQVEEKHPDYLERDVGSHNLAYMRRMNGDSMLRERCYEDQHSISIEHEAVKTQEKILLKAQKQKIQQEVLRQKERGFEMGM